MKSSYPSLRDIWPTLGDSYRRPSPGRHQSPSFTKKGPGRKHRQGKST